MSRPPPDDDVRSAAVGGRRTRQGRDAARSATVGLAVVTAVALLVALAMGQLAAREGDGSADGGADGTTADTPLPGEGRHLDAPDRGAGGVAWPSPAGRPLLSATPDAENRHALQPAVEGWVAGRVAGQRAMMADRSLPWRYWLDPAVADQVDEQVVHQALAAWDGIAGSRWATSFAGYAAPDGEAAGSRSGGAVADGRSTVFLEDGCDGLTTANAYLFADGGLGVARYGTEVSQLVEADIGICPRAVDPPALRLALVHEVGHVIGLAHLCDPGDPCWDDAMGPGPHRCRVMFWQARPCQTGLDDVDRLAVATTYPTLRPLWGPSTEDAMARASFGLWDDGTAPAVVLVHPEVDAEVAAAGAVLAARLGGPVLQVRPDPQGCMVGTGAREANRALRRRGTVVLVGPWPPSCEQTGYDWDVRLRVVPATDAEAATQHMADLAGLADGSGMAAGPGGAVIWAGANPDGTGTAGPGDTDGGATGGSAAVPPGVVVAAGLAAGLDRPLLVLQGDGTATTTWLRLHGTTDVVILGPGAAQAAEGVAVAAPSVVTLQGDDPVGLSLEAADLVLARTDARPAGQTAQGAGDAGVGQGDGGAAAQAGGAAGRPVVLAGSAGGVAALAAVPVAATTGGVTVLSGRSVDPRVTAWLAASPPPYGWIVGADDLPPPLTRAAYGALIGP